MSPTFLTLQERVRQFNLGTPTAMHVGTHELVNELWREVEKLSEAAQAVLASGSNSYRNGGPHDDVVIAHGAYVAIRAAIAAAVGDRPAAAQPQIQREGETQ